MRSNPLGQPEFYATHELFLGRGGALFLLLCRVDGPDGYGAAWESFEYWLRFIASCTTSMVGPPPMVVLAVNVGGGHSLSDAHDWLAVQAGPVATKYQGVLHIMAETPPSPNSGDTFALNCTAFNTRAMDRFAAYLQVVIVRYGSHTLAGSSGGCCQT